MKAFSVLSVEALVKDFSCIININLLFFKNPPRVGGTLLFGMPSSNFLLLRMVKNIIRLEVSLYTFLLGRLKFSEIEGKSLSFNFAFAFTFHLTARSSVESQPRRLMMDVCRCVGVLFFQEKKKLFLRERKEIKISFHDVFCTFFSFTRLIGFLIKIFNKACRRDGR